MGGGLVVCAVDFIFVAGTRLSLFSILTMRAYFTHFVLAALLLAAALAGLNWWADPYGLYRDLARVPQQKIPVFVMSERVFKTVRLADAPLEVLLLGTSRTAIGIGRDQAAFAGKRVLNLATFGQPIREARQLFERVLAHDKPQAVLLGLDFFAFNTRLPVPYDYVDENYSPLRPYQLMFSISALSDSWKVLHHTTMSEGDCCYSDGFRPAQAPARLAGLYRHNFVETERSYLMKKYLPYPECSFDFAYPTGGSSMDDLREILKLAHQHHVDLRLFISPSHARQWETLAAAGLWDKWEAWKRELVDINADEAQRASAQVLPLWDFSGYDEISTENVPVEGDNKTQMRWYSDSAHYTQALGQRIVQTMFASAPKVRPTWGEIIRPDTLPARLITIRAARQAYRQSHPQDLAEIAQTAREVNQVKHCPSPPAGNL
jgi:hypothetical protein